MTEAGIDDGDLIVIRKQADAKMGEMVLDISATRQW